MGCAPSTRNKLIEAQAHIQQNNIPAFDNNKNIYYWKSLYDDSQNVLNYLHNILKISSENDSLFTFPSDEKDRCLVQYSKTYALECRDLLERFISLYEDYNGNIPRNRFHTNGDPNKAAFPLPKSVLNNQESLRSWLKHWNAFDCVVSTDGAWKMLGYLGDWSNPQPDDKLYRGWYSGWSWSFRIDGEAAWDVLPLGVIKRDIQTPDQEAIWQQRTKRTDLNDPARMERRRKELANYFNRKYAEGDSSYCNQYLKFAETLEAGWMQFQELCGNNLDNEINH